ncbi:MAG: hypothetical protein ACYC1C_18535 [Chloroflexota bacterium]
MEFPRMYGRGRIDLSSILGLSAIIALMTTLFGMLAYSMFGTTRNVMVVPSGRDRVEPSGESTRQAVREGMRDASREMTRDYRLSDLVRWGPILAGLFAALGFVVLSLSLGIAVGLSVGGTTGGAAVGVGIWTVITLIIAGFIGGWIASKTLAVGGIVPALINSTVVWGLLVVFLVFALAPGVTVVGTTIGIGAAWVTFISVALSLGGAIGGAYAGVHGEMQYYLGE